MRILVTGSTGFTGHYVVRELSIHADSVVGLTSDLTDKAAVVAEVKRIQPEAVIHLAAVTFVAHGNIKDFYEVNLIGTQNLLEAIYQSSKNIKSILLASSANVYGNQLEGKLDEDAPLNPANDYAVSKVEMEKMARLWVNRLPLFIVRPFNYTGVGQGVDFLIPKLIKHFKEKSSIIELGNLDVSREFNDVRMISVLYRKLVYIAPVGETFNICTGRGYSLREIIKLCEEITGHAIEIKINSKFVRSNEVKILIGDNKKLRSLIVNRNVINLKSTLQWMLNK